MYSKQHYVIKFVIDLLNVGGFLRVRRFTPLIKLTATISEILMKVMLSTINLTLSATAKTETHSKVLNTAPIVVSSQAISVYLI